MKPFALYICYHWNYSVYENIFCRDMGYFNAKFVLAKFCEHAVTNAYSVSCLEVVYEDHNC